MKFHAKMKILTFGANITLFGYFGLEMEKGIVIFEITTLQFFKRKFCKKINILKFEQKRPNFLARL